MFRVIGERFDDEIVERECSNFAEAIKAAEEISAHNMMDFVVVFNENLVVCKFTDGKMGDRK